MNKNPSVKTGEGNAPRAMDFPPTSFSNVMNALGHKVTPENFKTFEGWRIFVAGYNEAVSTINDHIKNRYPMP